MMDEFVSPEVWICRAEGGRRLCRVTVGDQGPVPFAPEYRKRITVPCKQPHREAGSQWREHGLAGKSDVNQFYYRLLNFLTYVRACDSFLDPVMVDSYEHWQGYSPCRHRHLPTLMEGIMRPYMPGLAISALSIGLLTALPAGATPFFFTTDSPDGLM